MKKFVIIAIIVLFLSACSVEPGYNQSVLDAQATINAAQARASAQAQYSANLTQTPEALHAKQTELAFMATQTQSAKLTQEELSSQTRRTEQSWQLTQMAGIAAATATQNYYDVQGTASAQNSIMQAELATQQVERERVTNTVRAIAPVAFGIIFCTVFIVAFWRWSQVETSRRKLVERDPRGDAPLHINGNTITDPDRAPGAIVTANNDLLALLLIALVEAKFGIKLYASQDRYTSPEVTLRDQMLDLATRGIDGQTPSRQRIQQAIPVQKLYTIHEEEPPELSGSTGDALDAEWKEAEND